MKKNTISTGNQAVYTKNVYFYIYNQILIGNYPASICRKLNKSRGYLTRYIKRLHDAKLLKKVGNRWEINQKITPEKAKKITKKLLLKRDKGIHFSLGTREKTHLHSLNINLPILSGKIYDKDWEMKEKLKNWIPKYTELDILDGLTIKNNNNKSITVFVHSRYINSLEEVDKLAYQVRDILKFYFKTKHNVVLDVENAKTENIHLATKDEDAESMIRKGEKFTLDLQKMAEKIFPKDNSPALAWIDGSPSKFTAETNDKDWKREYLNMPFTIRDIFKMVNLLMYSFKIMEGYREQITEHLVAVQDIGLGIKKWNKEIKNFRKVLKEVGEKLANQR